MEGQPIPVEQFAEELGLEMVYKGKSDTIVFHNSDINRAGMQIMGYYAHFRSERVQVLGRQELASLEDMPKEERLMRLEKLFSYSFPCLVVCHSEDVPKEIIVCAERAKTPVFLIEESTTKFIHRATVALDIMLAPQTMSHGVLLDVYGIGVMLTGKSGIGKSETALELIKRGHRLVADDAVLIKKISRDRLVGEAPELIRYLMEMRGIGIIDVKQMYGISSVIPSKSIDLIVEMERWDPDKKYDRLGLNDEYETILDVPIPKLSIPVAPGRNLVIILEVAAMNHRLKGLGYIPAKELGDRVERRVKQTTQS